MIILDSNILKGTSLRGPEAELLRAIRTTRVERVAAPWIVLEELAAQQALLYDKKYEQARAAIEALDKATPWRTVHTPTRYDSERVRKHWRSRYSEIVETLPTSPQAYEQAMFREANLLAPCKTVNSGKHKTGARDAAIWLTALEYAREHPDEVVYFVSNNTEDFGDGSSFEAPMDKDLDGIEDRFVLFTSLDSVLTRFATEADVDEAELTELLQRPLNHRAIDRAAHKVYGFMGAVMDTRSALREVHCRRWDSVLTVTFSTVDRIAAHEIAGHRWYTATARWLISGFAYAGAPSYEPPFWTNCSWETRVLLSPTAPNKGLTVIGTGDMVPPTIEDLPTLPLKDLDGFELGTPTVEVTSRERGLEQLMESDRYAYSGSFQRRLAARQLLVDEAQARRREETLIQEGLFPDLADE